ncbi:Fur-regulated basic protein FbpA [Neobacillus niacini]|uniref:Fur-regulated basic protein FbpA n=1 Tax=Neobacillus niacini TaxID=86668 RepID=UPI0039833FD9
MTNQLRKGVETLKLFYINRLIDSGLYNASNHNLDSLTLSELQSIFQKTFPVKITKLPNAPMK